MQRLLGSALLVIAVTLSGCLAVSLDGKPHRGHGPPPHAPAHGYRAHHGDAELVWDAGRDVYIVVGYADHYWVNDRFLRLHAGAWQVSSSLRGPWTVYPSRSLPPGLRKKHSSNPGHGNAGHGKGRGHPPAKGHW